VSITQVAQFVLHFVHFPLIGTYPELQLLTQVLLGDMSGLLLLITQAVQLVDVPLQVKQLLLHVAQVVPDL
jgi:hypothetical protein